MPGPNLSKDLTTSLTKSLKTMLHNLQKKTLSEMCCGQLWSLYEIALVNGSWQAAHWTLPFMAPFAEEGFFFLTSRFSMMCSFSFSLKSFSIFTEDDSGSLDDFTGSSSQESVPTSWRTSKIWSWSIGSSFNPGFVVRGSTSISMREDSSSSMA